ncbi:J domain-containing protein [Burkholderia cenocepacia]|uniref:J domain-containing protein n=1 Tax=Burkholderia cenocepacia TaxID=95486 RepID=UPI00076D5E86|nr:J domain-containing protein [Burkholderia cenocepacia]KWU26298.1 hypothetical protein AS149_25235 [Burkholderia cenocepacia]
MSDLLQPNILTVAGAIAVSVGVVALCFPRFFREKALRGLGKTPVIDAGDDVFDVFGKWRSSFTEEALEKRFLELQEQIRKRSPDVIGELALLDQLRARAEATRAKLAAGEHVPLASTHSNAGPTVLQKPSGSNWREVLGVGRNVYNLSEVRTAYRRKAREAHPDHQGGSHDAMAKVTAAYKAAKAELQFD